jgi:hypothetical protein
MAVSDAMVQESNIKTIFYLLIFGLIAFVQNMAFTWSSRSRNSGDPSYHRFAALCSNGVYWLCNLPMTLFILQWQHNVLKLLASGLVYTISTAEGSVLMMKILLKHESGKRMVGKR